VCGHHDHKAHVVLKGEMSHLQIRERENMMKAPKPSWVWTSVYLCISQTDDHLLQGSLTSVQMR
jgi:hypothetical protein